jgi:hypothetical protein
MKKHIQGAALVGCLAASLSAQAADVSFSGFSHGSQTVKFTVSDPNVSKTLTVNAGGFSTSVNGGPSFTSYCVDLYQTIAFNTTYHDYVFVGSHNFTNSDAYADLGRLYATAGVVNNSVREAAFQIAVWEIAYEIAPLYDLSSGSAIFTDGTAATSGALTLASTWLGLLGNNGAGPGIGVIESYGHQDIIYAPVPEPATVMLMAMGLFGLLTVASRRGLLGVARR